jgi:SLOG cluster4 family
MAQAQTNKIPELIDPQAMYTTNGQEAWRVLGIMAEFAAATERLRGLRPAVSMFGSARIKPGHPYYEKAEKIARLLSDAGFSVISGGGPGLMEAANRGAFAGKSPAIGLNILLPHEKGRNAFQDVSFDFRYFFSRKMMFVRWASAYVVPDARADRKKPQDSDHSGGARILARSCRLGERNAGRRAHDRRKRRRAYANPRGAGRDRRGDFQLLRKSRIHADPRRAREDAQSLSDRSITDFGVGHREATPIVKRALARAAGA